MYDFQKIIITHALDTQKKTSSETVYFIDIIDSRQWKCNCQTSHIAFVVVKRIYTVSNVMDNNEHVNL